MELNSVHNDRHSYYLTCREWAKNLEPAHDEIINRWCEQLYRIFHLYLWGSAHAFFKCSMDAYRVVIELPANRGQSSSSQRIQQ
jgi:cyclopropane-fatty-acyl-phospholipid synthase